MITHSSNQDESSFSITANILFNLAHLGISITDSRYFDIDTYSELVELELQVLNGQGNERKATQKDIDMFLL